VFTALGDPVNVAARLQDMTKTLDCKAIISGEVFATAGIRADALAHTEVAIRGREEPMAALVVADPSVLTGLLENDMQEPPRKPASEPQSDPGNGPGNFNQRP
jgi:adenylate cyclase